MSYLRTILLITIPFHEDGSVGEPKPLVWGRWGENLCEPQGASVMTIDTTPAFHGGVPSLPGILATTSSRDEEDHVFSRLFYLEPPPEGLLSVDYTQVQPGVEGIPPYEEDPFYLKRIYVNAEPEPVELMMYSPYGGSACASAVPADLDGTGFDDLIVTNVLCDFQEQV